MLIPKQKPKAIITDVDSTLTERTTWYELTERLGGSSYKHADLFMKYLRGKISFQQVKKDLFKLWNTNGPVHKNKLIEIFRDIPLRGEAFSLINQLQEKGYSLCLISGSIEMFIDEIAKKFNIDHYYGNSIFHFDENGYWTDLDYTRNEEHLKIKQFEDFLKKTGFKDDECIAIGDGDNDLELFSRIPGIVVNPKSEHLKELAWQEVKYLPRVLQLLESIE
ncbi:HAD-IB family phosphatase [Patescibacteria group bacterium]|nr:HAD-IB family phosphatase [Patescibacteria group bacterium]